MKGFRAFLLRGNVIELAVAVVIGVAFGMVITAFVKDLVTPLIAAIGGQPDFSTLSFTINNSKFMYGDFLNALPSVRHRRRRHLLLRHRPLHGDDGAIQEGGRPTTKQCTSAWRDPNRGAPLPSRQPQPS